MVEVNLHNQIIELIMARVINKNEIFITTKYQSTKYQKQVLLECGDYTTFMGGK